MKQLVSRLIRSDEGQDLIEYGLLVGITAIGPKVAQYFTSLNAAMP